MIIKFLKRLRIIIIKIIYRKYLTAGNGFTCGRGTVFFAKNKITIGNNVYIGKYCTIECDSTIGHEVMISNNVGLVGRRDHDYTHLGTPIRYAPCIRDNKYEMPDNKSQIVIGDDVWIGFGSIILSGVKIGQGSIIAAGSIVTKNIEPFSIAAGIPAKIIKKRFTDDDTEKHIQQCKKKLYSSYQKRESSSQT